MSIENAKKLLKDLTLINEFKAQPDYEKKNTWLKEHGITIEDLSTCLKQGVIPADQLEKVSGGGNQLSEDFSWKDFTNQKKQYEESFGSDL